MTITTERAEELAVRREYQEDYRCAEAIRALTKERDELLRSVESYQFALAETEALELQHGAVVARLQKTISNLEARDIHSCGPDCQRSGCVNRKLREQLAAVEKARDDLKANAIDFEVKRDVSVQTLENVKAERNCVQKALAAQCAETKQLREQLAAAQAVIAKKDEALDQAPGRNADLGRKTAGDDGMKPGEFRKPQALWQDARPSPSHTNKESFFMDAYSHELNIFSVTFDVEYLYHPPRGTATSEEPREPAEIADLSVHLGAYDLTDLLDAKVLTGIRAKLYDLRAEGDA